MINKILILDASALLGGFKPHLINQEQYIPSGVIEEIKSQWERGENVAWELAVIHVALGETELALDWLERSVDLRDPFMISLKINPRFDSIRTHPRYIALLEKMKLD